MKVNTLGRQIQILLLTLMVQFRRVMKNAVVQVFIQFSLNLQTILQQGASILFHQRLPSLQRVVCTIVGF